MPAHHIAIDAPARSNDARRSAGHHERSAMSDTTRGLGGTGGYEIRTQGHISERLSHWFEGMTFVLEADGTTLIRCPALDQAALHGLLAKVRDLGLPLISVTTTPTSNERSPR
jgi:hypothetical protein